MKLDKLIYKSLLVLLFVLNSNLALGQTCPSGTQHTTDLAIGFLTHDNLSEERNETGISYVNANEISKLVDSTHLQTCQDLLQEYSDEIAAEWPNGMKKHSLGFYANTISYYNPLQRCNCLIDSNGI